MIGIYDSGIGGITVLAPLLKLLPEKEYFYLADYEMAPLGTKKEEELRKIIFERTHFLIQKQCQLIVLACNTASTFVEEIRKQVSIPIIAIEPSIKVAYDHQKDEKTIVMATPYTLQSKKFKKLQETYPLQDITLLSCENLASWIEEGNDKKIKSYLQTLFKSYNKNQKIQIVLGCTHYPLIKKEIQEIFPNATISDGGIGVAKQVKTLVGKEIRDSNGKITFFFTDGKDRTKQFKKVLKTYSERLEKI